MLANLVAGDGLGSLAAKLVIIIPDHIPKIGELHATAIKRNSQFSQN